jgi:hypothetical protein
VSEHRTVIEAHPFHGYIINPNAGTGKPAARTAVLGPEYLAWVNQFPTPQGDPERVEMSDPNCPKCRAEPAAPVCPVCKGAGVYYFGHVLMFCSECTVGLKQAEDARFRIKSEIQVDHLVLQVSNREQVEAILGPLLVAFRELDALNYLEFNMADFSTKEEYSVLLQRKKGETPAQQNARLRALLHRVSEAVRVRENSTCDVPWQLVNEIRAAISGGGQ